MSNPKKSTTNKPVTVMPTGQPLNAHEQTKDTADMSNEEQSQTSTVTPPADEQSSAATPVPEPLLHENLTPWSPAISNRLATAIGNLLATSTTESLVMRAQQTLHAEVIRVLLNEEQDRVNIFVTGLLAVIDANYDTTFNNRMRLRAVNDAFTPVEREEFCALINLFCDMANTKKRRHQLAKFPWHSLTMTVMPARADAVINKLKNFFGVA